MCRFQHIDGQSKVNELDVRLGRPVKVMFHVRELFRLHALDNAWRESYVAPSHG